MQAMLMIVKLDDEELKVSEGHLTHTIHLSGWSLKQCNNLMVDLL